MVWHGSADAIMYVGGYLHPTPKSPQRSEAGLTWVEQDKTVGTNDVEAHTACLGGEEQDEGGVVGAVEPESSRWWCHVAGRGRASHGEHLMGSWGVITPRRWPVCTLL